MKQFILSLLIGLPLFVYTGENTDTQNTDTHSLSKDLTIHARKAGLWSAVAYGGYKGSILLKNIFTQIDKENYEFLDLVYRNKKNRIPSSLHDKQNIEIFTEQYDKFKKQPTLQNFINIKYMAQQFLKEHEFITDLEKYRLAQETLRIAILPKPLLFRKTIWIAARNTALKIAPVACVVSSLYFMGSHVRSINDIINL